MHKEVILANKTKLKELGEKNRSIKELHLAFSQLMAMLKEEAEVIVVIDGLPAARVIERNEGYIFTVIQGRFENAKLNDGLLQLTERGKGISEFRFSAQTNAWESISPEQSIPADPSIFN